MAVRQAEAQWDGDLKSGKGNFRSASGAFQGNYSFGTRFEEQPGTNPEELIGAAHAGCFSMALAGALSKAGFSPKRIATKANVHLEKVDQGFAITKITLETEAVVPDIDESTFQEKAKGAKEGCPVSKALAAVQIELDAKLAK